MHEQTAVGVRVCADAVLAGRRQRLEFGNQLAVFVEQLLRMVAAQPLLEHGPGAPGCPSSAAPDARGSCPRSACRPRSSDRSSPSGCAARSSGRSDGSCRRSRAHACGWRGFPRLRLIERVRQCAVYLHRLIALDEVRLPAAALEASLRSSSSGDARQAGSGWRSCSRSGAGSAEQRRPSPD